MVAHKSSRDVLSQLHEQHAQDKKNDRMETGSFPVVRKKPKRPVKDGSARMRLMTSVLILIMCALLGYGYMIQINNADATYETLSEDELTRLISETGTQVQNLEQRKSELTNQLESLKAAANKTQEAERIAKQNEETNGILGSLGLPVPKQQLVTSQADALKAARKLGGIDALVVKPLLDVVAGRTRVVRKGGHVSSSQ